MSLPRDHEIFPSSGRRVPPEEWASLALFIALDEGDHDEGWRQYHALNDRLRWLKMMVGCAECGYRVNSSALDFDHVKSIKIGEWQSSWVSILRELPKLEVVCANCHRVRTTTRRHQDRSFTWNPVSVDRHEDIRSLFIEQGVAFLAAGVVR